MKPKFLNKETAARRVAVTSLMAAVYVVLTVALPIPQYSAIQFRVAEVMNLLVFFNPVFAPGIILGVFIANMFSPYLLLDMIFGTSATVLALFCIRRSPGLFKSEKLSLLVAALMPVVFNAPIISIMILLVIGGPFTLAPFLAYMAWVGIGQFTVMVLLAYPLFLLLQETNPEFMRVIKNY